MGFLESIPSKSSSASKNPGLPLIFFLKTVLFFFWSLALWQVLVLCPFRIVWSCIGSSVSSSALPDSPSLPFCKRWGVWVSVWVILVWLMTAGESVGGWRKDEDHSHNRPTASSLSTPQVRLLSFLQWHGSEKACTRMHVSRCPSQLSGQQWALLAASDVVLSTMVDSSASSSGSFSTVQSPGWILWSLHLCRLQKDCFHL